MLENECRFLKLSKGIYLKIKHLVQRRLFSLPLPSKQTYLENITGAFPTQVVLTGEDDHGLREHLQADGTDELLLQVIHGLLLFGKRLVIQGCAHLLAVPVLLPGKGASNGSCK